MKLTIIVKEIVNKMKGRLRIAVENGMVVEPGVSVMGG